MNSVISGRVGSLLGLARRSGRLTTGFDAVVGAIRSGKRATVLIADDLSQKTEKELKFALRDHNCETVFLPMNKIEIGRVLGFNKPVGVMCIDDTGFADAVRTLCRRYEGDTKEE